jgi:hypothetical protein
MSIARLKDAKDLIPWANMVVQTIERAIEELREVRGVQSVTDDYTATNRDKLVLADATSAALTVTLYSAVGNKGRTIAVKKTDSSANAVTVDGAGSETIDGSATASLSSQWSAKTLQSDGSNWFVIGSV